MHRLEVVLIKPSKYDVNGYVERFEHGFMPNATLYHIAGLTPKKLNGTSISVTTIDEYVWTSRDYLSSLCSAEVPKLVAIVGVQSHQFNRALDLAAYAIRHGVRHCVIGGPHVMTCDTSEFQKSGVSFAVAEAEVIWGEILADAICGELKPIYGTSSRWSDKLPGPVIDPPTEEALDRYWAPMLGLYPTRGCPYRCNYCSVIKISGHSMRSEPVLQTIRNLRTAVASGINTVMFVSDNFNKYPQVEELLTAIIEERIRIRFFCQCDTKIAKQPELVALLAKAGCFEMFVGVESFNRATLKNAKKFHNYPDQYPEIIRLCGEHGIRAHFSNIIGFPHDDLGSVTDHLEYLIELSPHVVSFYILTPIPGTEQYDEFMQEDLIFEHNLDRFDGTCCTWRHPHIDKQALESTLYRCYKNYYKTLMDTVKLSEETRRIAIMSRHAAQQRRHPMAGGINPCFVDRSLDYQAFRHDVFGKITSGLPMSYHTFPN